MPFQNYSSTLIEQAGRIGPTLRERMAPMAQGIGGAAAGASTAIQNLVLSRGADALDAGLKELQAAGLSNPALEQFFKQTDPTNPEAVSLALDKMADLVKGGRGDVEARGYLEQGITSALGGLGPNATPEEIAAARSLGADSAMAMGAARGTAPSLNPLKARAAMIAGTSDSSAAQAHKWKMEEIAARSGASIKRSEMAMDDKQAARLNQFYLKMQSQLDPILTDMGELSTHIVEIKTIAQDYQDAGVTAAGLGESAKGQEAATILSYISSGAIKYDRVAELAGRLADPKALEVAYARNSGKADYDNNNMEQRAQAMRYWLQDQQMVASQARQAIASYMKAISGAAIAEPEMKRLETAIGFAFGTSPAVFYKAMNTLMAKIRTKYDTKLQLLKAAAGGPTAEARFGIADPVEDFMSRLEPKMGEYFPKAWERDSRGRNEAANEMERSLENLADQALQSAKPIVEQVGDAATAVVEKGKDLLGGKKTPASVPASAPASSAASFFTGAP